MITRSILVVLVAVLVVGTAHAANKAVQASVVEARVGEACGGEKDIRCAPNLWCDPAMMSEAEIEAAKKQKKKQSDDAKMEGDQCTNPSRIGKCVDVLSRCEDAIQMVCGCDGRTYQNDCRRRSARVAAQDLEGACKSELVKKCEKEWSNYEEMHSRTARFLLGGAKFKATGNYGNTSGDTLDGTGVAAELDSNEIGGSVDLGYFEKSVLRDARFLVGGRDQFRRYCELGENHPSRLLFWDALKLDLQGGYGTTVTDERSSLKTEDDFKTEDKWRYSVGLTYELPFEGFVEGLLELGDE